LHISFAGIYGFSSGITVGEGHDIRLLAARDCLDVVEANRDLIIVIKVRLGCNASGEAGIVPLDVAEQVADETDLPPMVQHIDEPPLSYEPVLDRLRPRDVLTHAARTAATESTQISQIIAAAPLSRASCHQRSCRGNLRASGVGPFHSDGNLDDLANG
jgi:predicted amidohydrolase